MARRRAVIKENELAALRAAALPPFQLSAQGAAALPFTTGTSVNYVKAKPCTSTFSAAALVGGIK
jgi:hypothetical protein